MPPLLRLVADVFGIVTISLLSVFVILGLICIVCSVYFSSRIRRYDLLQLWFFNGPWIIRIVLILVSIWWCCGEVIRLTLLKGEGRLLTAPKWQKGVCKFYIISNIGFAEPSMFVILVFLLHASLQKKEYGALSHRWNTRATIYTLLYCFPMFLIQLVLVLIGRKFSNEEEGLETKLRILFTSTSFLTGDNFTCTYPLMNTIALGLFDFALISYLSCLGFRMVASAINKGMERRIYFLIVSVLFFLPLRICLLGLSILPQPGGLAHEAIVFLAFLMLLFCALVGVCMLVYYPVADSWALRSLRHLELEDIPLDGYDVSSSLIVNQSYFDAGNSDAYANHSSISLQTEETLAKTTSLSLLLPHCEGFTSVSSR